MRPRGFSLALVLLVSTIALLVGAAVAALSSMSMSLAAEELGRSRARALAMGVLAQVRYELDRESWRRSVPKDAPSMRNLRARFASAPIFPDPNPEILQGGLQAWVDFAHPHWYSVDNLLGGEAAASCRDAGTSRTSVPPYSLDLVVMTGAGDTPDRAADARRFEAVITRIWPFAVYSADAPIRIDSGARIRGSVYAANSPLTVGDTSGALPLIKGDLCSGLPREKKPVQVKTGALEGKIRYDVPTWGRGDGDPQALTRELTLLMPLDGSSPEDFVPPYKPLPESTARRFSTIGDFQVLLGGRYTGKVGAGLHNLTNRLLERVTVWHGSPLTQLRDLNVYRGHINFRLPWDHQGNSLEAEGSFFRARILIDDLELQDDYYETPSISNHFAVMNVISNGFTTYETLAEDLWTGNPKRPASLRLDNCVLKVRGDLDIRDLSGENSALIVEGNLYLNGGSLDSGNKGMLILANNVIMEARGDFRGLVAARGNLWLKPLASGERLTMRGGVLVGGEALKNALRDAVGTVLQGASSTRSCAIGQAIVIHDTRYTRSLNRFGVSRLSLFQELR